MKAEERSAVTLNEKLQSLGFTTKPASGVSKKHIVDSQGRVVFTGNAGQVWEWIAEEKFPDSLFSCIDTKQPADRM